MKKPRPLGRGWFIFRWDIDCPAIGIMTNPRKEFSKIFDNCVNKIYRFVFVKVNSEEVANDLTSETFLKGWQAFQASCGDEGQKIENPQAFLYKIARNLVIDYYRQKGRTQVISADNAPIPDPRPSGQEKAIFNSDLDRIKVILADLNDDYQSIIVWHYLDDLPIAEIAKIMDKTEDTARVTLHRALKALKSRINPPVEEV